MKKLSTKDITIIGLLASLTIILGLTPLGSIPLGPFMRATILHIPTIIGAIMCGPFVGGILGLIFGIFSLVQNLIAPTVFSFMFWNPLVSVLPRMLIGIGTGYFYIFLKKINFKKTLIPFITGGIGSIINTVGVLGMSFILYGSKTTQTGGENTAKLLITVASTNFPFELVLTIFLVGFITIGLLKSKKSR